MANIEEQVLRDSIKIKQAELLALNQRLREIERAKLPVVQPDTYWRSRLLDCYYHVLDVGYVMVSGDLLHVGVAGVSATLTRQHRVSLRDMEVYTPATMHDYDRMRCDIRELLGQM